MSTFTDLNAGGENIPGSVGGWISNFEAYIDYLGTEWKIQITRLHYLGFWLHKSRAEIKNLHLFWHPQRILTQVVHTLRTAALRDAKLFLVFHSFLVFSFPEYSLFCCPFARNIYFCFLILLLQVHLTPIY